MLVAENRSCCVHCPVLAWVYIILCCVREALKDWILAGYVEVIDWPPETLKTAAPKKFIREAWDDYKKFGAQNVAFQQIRHLKDSSWWWTRLDTDCFLFPHKGDSVGEFLSQYDPKVAQYECAALCEENK